MKDKLIAKLKELNVKLNRFVEYLHTAVEFGEDADWEEVFDHKLTKIKRLESEIASLESELAKEEPEGIDYIFNSNDLTLNWDGKDYKLVPIQEPEGVTADVETVLFDVMTDNNFTYVSFPAFVENESSVDVFDIACKAMERIASSKQIDKRKFLKDFNSWMCGKQYDGRIPLIDTCITEYLNNL